jgi:hypothetical protein
LFQDSNGQLRANRYVLGWAIRKALYSRREEEDVKLLLRRLNSSIGTLLWRYTSSASYRTKSGEALVRPYDCVVQFCSVVEQYLAEHVFTVTETLRHQSGHYNWAVRTVLASDSVRETWATTVRAVLSPRSETVSDHARFRAMELVLRSYVLLRHKRHMNMAGVDGSDGKDKRALRESLKRDAVLEAPAAPVLRRVETQHTVVTVASVSKMKKRGRSQDTVGGPGDDSDSSWMSSDESE